MRKVLSLFIALALVLSASVFVVSARPEGKGKGNGNKIEKQNEKSVVDEVYGEEDKDPKVKKEKKEKKQKSVTEDVYGKDSKEALKALKKQFKEDRKDEKKRRILLNKIRKMQEKEKQDVTLVFINGSEIECDVPPVIKYGRTLVPVRAITNGLGAEVGWDQETKTVTVTKAVYGGEDMVIVIQLGSNIATVNGVELEIDVAAEVNNNRTMVPIRFISEVFKLKVDWEGEAKTVVIEEEGEDEDEDEESVEETATPTPEATPTPTPVPTPTPNE